MDDDHVLDTMLFFSVALLSLIASEVWDADWLILFGLPWFALFILSVWRVMK